MIIRPAAYTCRMVELSSLGGKAIFFSQRVGPKRGRDNTNVELALPGLFWHLFSM